MPALPDERHRSVRTDTVGQAEHYEESQRAERVLVVDEPCPLRVDLDALADPDDL